MTLYEEQIIVCCSITCKVNRWVFAELGCDVSHNMAWEVFEVNCDLNVSDVPVLRVILTSNVLVSVTMSLPNLGRGFTHLSPLITPISQVLIIIDVITG